MSDEPLHAGQRERAHIRFPAPRFLLLVSQSLAPNAATIRRCLMDVHVVKPIVLMVI
jgi:hypothetical protein